MANLKETILEKIKSDGPSSIEELQIPGVKRHSIRGRISELRKSNCVIKLDNNKFDLSPSYRKGLP